MSTSMLVSMLLEGEKEDMRRWLRAEMDQLVDPLIDRLFDKLGTKLTAALGRNELEDCGDREHANYDQEGQTNMQVEVKEEFDESTNEQLFSTDQTQYLSLSLPTSTNQNQSNPNLLNRNYDLDRDDDGESDALTEPIEHNQNDKKCLPPSKKARLDPTRIDQAHQVQPSQVSQSQSRTNRKQPNEANNHDKQYITLSVRCLQPECPQMFVQKEVNPAIDQLNEHLLNEHFIGLFRCAVKECNKSFDNCNHLGEHIKQAHQSTTEWHCGKCVKQFPTYQLLSHHSHRHHQLGQFQCSYPTCAFIGENKEKFFTHFRQHKPNALLICSQVGCGRRLANVSLRKIHEQTHLGTVPYRCKWPECEYLGRTRGHTIVHIRQVHLKQPNAHPNLSEADFNDPKDYYEVAQDLM